MATKEGAMSPSRHYLKLVCRQIEGIRRDLPHLIAMGEKMAGYLLDGGNICTPAVNPFWPPEFGGRAGGLMCIKGSVDNGKDVAYFALSDPRKSDPAKNEALQKLIKAKAHLFVIGRREDLGALADHPRIEMCTGGGDPEEGFYQYDQFAPLAHVRAFEQIVRGWITTGEMIAACIRAEKMPIIWMSVWLEGSVARNASFAHDEQSNYGEPGEYGWSYPLKLFHRERFVPPLAPGHVAKEFLAGAELFVDALDKQSAILNKAGQWMADAFSSRKRVWAVATGHSHPQILELPEKHNYPIEWGPPISSIARAIPEDLKKGDVALHLGYGPVHLQNLENLLKRGVNYIHTTPFGKRAGMPERKNFLWFDLPWRPADAWVDVPGYSVRLLPSSSTAHTIAYNAVLCEMAEQLGWK